MIARGGSRCRTAARVRLGSHRAYGERAVKLTIPEGVLFEEVDGQVVLLSLEGGAYYMLNGSGSRVWELIREHGDLDQVEAAMAAEYAADAELIHREVAQLVDELQARGLVALDGP